MISRFKFDRQLIRPGDWLVAGLGLVVVGVSVVTQWLGNNGAVSVVVRQNGEVVARLPITTARTLTVPGPLGETVIEVAPGRARVAADPSPRQLCVRQGWLTKPGSMAFCLPSRLSIVLEKNGQGYDTMVY